MKETRESCGVSVKQARERQKALALNVCAAEAGDVRALMVLGESYDPATLARMGALGIKGDADKARDYYAKALAAGMGAARERMAAMESE